MSLTTAELRDRLQRHYIKPGAPLPGGVFLPEVGWNNGSGRGGCDVIFVGFTTTSGRTLIGHELKVSRADWLNELNKPGKSDAWADECHEWWLVVNEPAIVHDGELPAGWGLMSPGTSKTRMRIHRAADRKGTDHAPSWLACRSIIARQDTLRAQAIAGGSRRQHEELSKQVRPLVDAEVERRMRAVPDTERLQKQLKQIQDALGYEIDWSDRAYVTRGHLSLDDLAVIGKAAKENRNLIEAARSLTEGYQLQGLRRSLEQLELSIATIRALPGTQLELT